MNQNGSDRGLTVVCGEPKLYHVYGLKYALKHFVDTELQFCNVLCNMLWSWELTADKCSTVDHTGSGHWVHVTDTKMSGVRGVTHLTLQQKSTGMLGGFLVPGNKHTGTHTPAHTYENTLHVLVCTSLRLLHALTHSYIKPLPHT